MKVINLKIERRGNDLTLSSYTKSLGSQNDDNDRKIVFRRPKENEGDDLTLHFFSRLKNLGSFNIGHGNEFPIAKAFTEETELRLQISFENDVMTVYSNIVAFNLRPALLNSTGVSDDLSDCDQHGESNIAWRPVLSKTGDLSWIRSDTETPPETINIIGPQGKQGLQGIPGSGATINGIETLDIIDSETVTAEIDSENKTVKFTSLLIGEAQPRIGLTLTTNDELGENGNEMISIQAGGSAKQFTWTDSNGVFENKFIKTETPYTFVLEQTPLPLQGNIFEIPNCSLTTGTLNLPLNVNFDYVRNDLTNPAYYENILDVIEENNAKPHSVNMATFGSVGTSAAKWSGGVLAPNGKIYGIPRDSSVVLEIDPTTRTATTFGSLGTDTGKWFGGVLAPDGKIYGIPYSASTVLEIDPVTQTATTFGSVGASAGKWVGGVLAPNGKIYGIAHNDTAILEIDPKTKTISTFGSLNTDSNKWYGGVLAANGKIYGIPRNSSTVLEIDPITQTASTFGNVGSATGKWTGGVLAHNGKIYGIPNAASAVLEIDPITLTATTFGSVGTSAGKWVGGVLAHNGKIYGMPSLTSTILEIDPTTQAVTISGSMGTASGRWAGGSLAPNGKIYGIPSGDPAILEIEIAGLTNFGPTSLRTTWLNIGI